MDLIYWTVDYFFIVTALNLPDMRPKQPPRDSRPAARQPTSYPGSVHPAQTLNLGSVQPAQPLHLGSVQLAQQLQPGSASKLSRFT